jgi:hypothetical protein
MNRRTYALLYLLGLAIAFGMAAFQPSPGYMDADYSYATGKQLASGKGFFEPFLWNYLDDPAGIPHPSHLYWMPLASLLAAAGMWASGAQAFFTARLGFILLAASLPPVTAALARSFGLNRRQAWTGGLLALFPGFYLPFLTTTDTFGIYMLLGAGLLQLGYQAGVVATSSGPRSSQVWKWLFLAGFIAGLMHLARADGILWVPVGLAAAWAATGRRPGSEGGSAFQRVLPRILGLSCLLAGYLVVILPWMGRNLYLGGGLSAPGASRALWITSYDELFIYPAGLLTPARWWASGLEDLVQVRLWALGQNLQTALAVQGEVFLLPLVLAGLWRFREDPRVRLGVFAWLLTFLVMTVIFPFQGARGGFFHSGAGVQILFWALAPAGLASVLSWGARFRRWHSDRAEVVYAAGLAGLALLVTLITTFSGLGGGEPVHRSWGKSEAAYARLEPYLKEAGAPPGSAVMVNNPPGYFSATGRPALVIPDGNESAALQVARRYQSAYLLLERDHPRGLGELYHAPGDRPGMDYLLTVDGVHIFYMQIE